jgi:RimJ/RimL family protein N-acetyltransferase
MVIVCEVKMAESIIIRPIQPGDVASVRHLLALEDAHYVENGNKSAPFEADSPYHPDQMAPKIVSAATTAGSESRGWLAFCGGVPAGIITTDDLGGGVFVDKKFNGKNLATELVKAREQYWFNELGLDEIRRPVRADNERSIGLHIKKLGYEFDKASQEILAQNPPGETVVHLCKKNPALDVNRPV